MIKPKFIFVTGGVVSGLGKGITAASIGRLLKQRRYKVSMQKLDPYVNFDPGLMHPSEHGECFVTFDGGETDLDLGHYERFIDEKLTKNSSVTTGKIYQSVIQKERKGFYKGKTVQIIPHITDEIKEAIKKIYKDNKSQINIIEVGGTVGDIESLPYIEAIRQMRNKLGKENTLFIHCTLVPFIKATNEYKSKPTQQSVATLRALGIQPDVIVTRSETPLDENLVNKIAMFCNVKKSSVIQATDNPIVYDMVNKFFDQKLDKTILNHLNLKLKTRNSKEWDNLINSIKNSKGEVKIAIVGKYRMIDAYRSVISALKHCGYFYKTEVKFDFIYSGDINKSNINDKLKGYHGILIPGGFGSRGTNGKILAIEYARTKKVPFLGICYGMQLATIEYARNVLKLNGADHTEINPKTPFPIIDIMPGKTHNTKSGVLRLGDQEAKIVKGTHIAKAYKNTPTYIERHRHKYEFAMTTYNKYFQGSKMIYSSTNLDETLIETIEITGHPFFLGEQYHGELTSKPTKPAPTYREFIAAAIKHKK